MVLMITNLFIKLKLKIMILLRNAFPLYTDILTNKNTKFKHIDVCSDFFLFVF